MAFTQTRTPPSAVAVSLAARLADIVDSKLPLANIVTGLGRNRAALPALVVYQALDLAIRVPGGARSAVLVEGANAALGAVGAGDLFYRLVLVRSARVLHSSWGDLRPWLKRRSPPPPAIKLPIWS